MNKNVIIDITSYIRHLTKMVIKVSLAMILAVEMLSGSITGVMRLSFFAESAIRSAEESGEASSTTIMCFM